MEKTAPKRRRYGLIRAGNHRNLRPTAHIPILRACRTGFQLEVRRSDGQRVTVTGSVRQLAHTRESVCKRLRDDCIKNTSERTCSIAAALEATFTDSSEFSNLLSKV